MSRKDNNNVKITKRMRSYKARQLLPIIPPSVCILVTYFFSDFFSRNTGPNLIKLGTKDFYGKEILNVKIKGITNYETVKIG